MKQHIIGEIINNRYKIEKVLGSGGMSNVYLVSDEKLKSRWALKEMVDVFPIEEREGILEQFRREAQILAGIKHPSLPRVFDYFEENHCHYIVMEYIEGTPLEEILQKEGRISGKRAVSWGIQLCEVLSSLHSEGIIYRDLKPDNILADKEDKIYLIDFGIARLFSGGKLRDTILIGTPGFASPEHHGKAETDARSDIFSLGATLHYLTTGADPQLIPFVFKKPSVLNPQIPDELSDVILKAVSLDPSERYQTAEEMKSALSSINLFFDLKRKDSPDKKSIINTPAHRSSYVTTTTALPDHFNNNNNTNEVKYTAGKKLYKTGKLRTLLPPVSISAGVTAAGVFLSGSVFSPLLLLYGAAAMLPLSYLSNRLYSFIFKIPGNIEIVVEDWGINIKRREIDKKIDWTDITGLLVFQEKSRLNTITEKFKLITQKGGFEYGHELSDFEKFNKIIIEKADLILVSSCDEFKRYIKKEADDHETESRK